jgi:hypothetical protein
MVPQSREIRWIDHCATRVEAVRVCSRGKSRGHVKCSSQMKRAQIASSLILGQLPSTGCNCGTNTATERDFSHPQAGFGRCSRDWVTSNAAPSPTKMDSLKPGVMIVEALIWRRNPDYLKAKIEYKNQRQISPFCLGWAAGVLHKRKSGLLNEHIVNIS